MLQSEIGSAACNAEGELPRKGLRIRDFELMNREGKPVRLSDFRSHFNLALLFLGIPDDWTIKFAEELRKYSEDIEHQDARVLMVFAVPTKKLTRLPDQKEIVVLSDPNGLVHEAVGAKEGQNRYAPACYITDRYAEVFAVFRAKDGNVMPTVKEVIGWLEFVDGQCPECEPPEWPADAA